MDELIVLLRCYMFCDVSSVWSAVEREQDELYLRTYV